MSPTIEECLERARRCEWYAARTNDEEDGKFLCSGFGNSVYMGSGPGFPTLWLCAVLCSQRYLRIKRRGYAHALRVS